jgi:hypothetical protein
MEAQTSTLVSGASSDVKDHEWPLSPLSPGHAIAMLRSLDCSLAAGDPNEEKIGLAMANQPSVNISDFGYASEDAADLASDTAHDLGYDSDCFSDYDACGDGGCGFGADY